MILLLILILINMMLPSFNDAANGVRKKSMQSRLKLYLDYPVSQHFTFWAQFYQKSLIQHSVVPFGTNILITEMLFQTKIHYRKSNATETKCALLAFIESWKVEISVGYT